MLGVLTRINMIPVKFFICILLALIFHTPQAFANQSRISDYCLANPHDKKTVIIFGNRDSAPKTYLNGGKPYGIIIDILDYIETKSNLCFDIRLYAWKRSYDLAEKGKGGIVGFSKNQERLKKFDYSKAVNYDHVSLIVRSDKVFEFKSIKDLAGKTLGAIRGSSYGDEYEYGRNHIFKLEEDNGSVQRLAKVLNGHIDAAVVSLGKAGLNYAISQNNFLFDSKDKLTVLDRPLLTDQNYMGFAKSMNKTDVIETVNEILAEGYTNGDILEIIAKWESY